MNLRSNKGITGVDISVAILILILLVGVVAALISNYTSNSKEINRKSTASYIIIDILEYAKSSNYGDLKQEMIDGYVGEKYDLKNDGYKVKAKLQTSEDIYGEGAEDIMKKITVNVSYLVNNEEENLEIYTIIKNPNFSSDNNTQLPIWFTND